MLQELRLKKKSGERGIRTLDNHKAITDFESVSFDHSDISPDRVYRGLSVKDAY
jgi:hypothetical protein